MLSLKDVKVGLEYGYVGCDAENNLWLEKNRITGMFEDDFNRFKTLITYFESDATPHSYSTERYFSSVGFTHGVGPYPDNYHRVFAYTPENYSLLSSIVKKQDFAAYLKLINVEVSEKFLEEEKKRKLAILDKFRNFERGEDFGAEDLYSFHEALLEMRVDPDFNLTAHNFREEQ